MSIDIADDTVNGFGLKFWYFDTETLYVVQKAQIQWQKGTWDNINYLKATAIHRLLSFTTLECSQVEEEQEV